VVPSDNPVVLLHIESFTRLFHLLLIFAHGVSLLNYSTYSFQRSYCICRLFWCFYFIGHANYMQLVVIWRGFFPAFCATYLHCQDFFILSLILQLSYICLLQVVGILYN